MSDVREVCNELLVGLDEDILEYIVGALEEFQNDRDSDEEETVTMISSFLESSGFVDDEDEALTKAKELIERVVNVSGAAANGAGGAPSSSTSSDEPKKLSEETKKLLTLSLQDESLTSNSLADPTATTTRKGKNTNTLIEDHQIIVKKTSSKKSSSKSNNNNSNNEKKLAYEQSQQQVLELEQELHQARITSIVERTNLGAYKGTLDTQQSFTLPNPGGGQNLLEDATYRMVWGHRYGLIGRNGTGKSTLLRALAARRVGDIPKQVTVHYVSQEVNLTSEQRSKTPMEVIVDADLERTMLLKELTLLTEKANAGELDSKGSERHGIVLSRLDDIDANSAERRAQSLLDHLGFSKELQSRSLENLSGGWRVRTMLAAAIFAKPDLLLLDEPTNHLSILAVMWLARELSTSDTWKSRIVVIVSHDRHFLDEVCTDCLHISGISRRLTQHRGNYSTWSKRRKEEQNLFYKEQSKRRMEIDTLKEYAGHGFRYGGSSSQINKMSMKAKQAEKLELIQKEHAEELASLQEDIELPIKIIPGGELDGYVVQLRDVAFGYNTNNDDDTTKLLLFEHCEFGITSKSRIVLLGENGNGKTTLVKLIMGDLQPTKGEIKRNPHARFALVNQHHADQIDLTLTPLQFLQEKFPGDGSYEHLQKLRGHLSSCGVTSAGSSTTSVGGTTKTKDLQNTPASALSGGQRSRVALAAVSYSKPHVLVLDEPTNNLDLESVAALAQCVQTFEGAVICVSHDQFFVQSVANEAWVVNDGTVKQVESFESYRKAQFKKLQKN